MLYIDVKCVSKHDQTGVWLLFVRPVLILLFNRRNKRQGVTRSRLNLVALSCRLLYKRAVKKETSRASSWVNRPVFGRLSRQATSFPVEILSNTLAIGAYETRCT